jgi:23S rRNA maturation-related 3'-5' exoribonuclease YhaM
MGQLTPLIDRASRIKDDEIRAVVIQAIYTVPAVTWSQRASRRHHLPDERREWGSRLHTCRVFDAAVFISEIYGIDGIQLDILMAGSLLHDIKKFGKHAEYNYTRDEHPFLVRELIDSINPDLKWKEEILLCIESHMGQWTVVDDKPAPVVFHDELNGPEARIVHLADCLVARFAEVMGAKDIKK